jgi:hypothetical protein
MNEQPERAKITRAYVTNPAVVEEAQNHPNSQHRVQTSAGVVIFRYTELNEYEMGCVATGVKPEQAEILAQMAGYEVDGYPSVTPEPQPIADHDIENERKKAANKDLTFVSDQNKQLLDVVRTALVPNAVSTVVAQPAISREELKAAELDDQAIDTLLNITFNKGAKLTPASPLVTIYFEASKIAKIDPAFSALLRDIVDESNYRKELAEELAPVTPVALIEVPTVETPAVVTVEDGKLEDTTDEPKKEAVVIADLAYADLQKLANEHGFKSQGVKKEELIAQLQNTNIAGDPTL